MNKLLFILLLPLCANAQRCEPYMGVKIYWADRRNWNNELYAVQQWMGVDRKGNRIHKDSMAVYVLEMPGWKPLASWQVLALKKYQTAEMWIHYYKSKP